MNVEVSRVVHPASRRPGFRTPNGRKVVNLLSQSPYVERDEACYRSMYFEYYYTLSTSMLCEMPGDILLQ